jgi:mannose-6-phosphate isomerase-like protein (cupin superfamily)
MLFQIEQDKVNPSVATVWKIARGLNVSFHTILSGENQEESPFEVLRKADSPVLVSEDGQCELRITSNVHFFDTIETYQMVLKPKAVLKSEPHFPGTEEILVILKGVVKVTSGGHSIQLRKGDSARYKADIGHGIENMSSAESTAIMTVYHKDIAATSNKTISRHIRRSSSSETSAQ